MNKDIKGLYIHIPFCSKICSYCDFYKMLAKSASINKYMEYLLKELEMKKDYYHNLRTIYIGGGTPTRVDHSKLEELLIGLHKYIDFSNIVEFTIEANPNHITKELVLLLKKYQVNRISLGVQSFNDDKLKILNRDHTEKEIINAMKILRYNGINNINVDIIYGVGNDNFKLVKDDLRKAIHYGATHISAYSLIIEEKTLIKKWVNEGKYIPLDGDTEYEIYLKLVGFLKKHRFTHYEISNFSKKNYHSNHNLLYWNNMNYIGIGTNSSYYLENVRYKNIANLNKYYEGIDTNNLNYEEVIVLSKEDQMKEEMIMGLRTIKGINLENFSEKFKEDALTVFPIIKNLIKLKLLKIKNNQLFIPEKKLYISNEVLVNFV